MKTNTQTSDIRSFGAESTTQAKIEVSAHLFETMTRNVYTDNIKAFIREISCNALDAHSYVGKSKVPIEVDLPTANKRIFRVRDFGPGLDEEEMKSIYINLGGSGHSKRKSNNAIGGFGIGSLSPMAYVDSFIINSIKDGKKIKSVFSRGALGIPDLKIYSITDTTEPSGVEIIIDIKKHEVNIVGEKASQVFQFFPVKPKTNIKLVYPEYITKYEGFLVRNNDTRGSNWRAGGLYVLMGAVAYETTWPYTHRLRYSKTVVIKAPIGQFQPQASRESLNKGKDHDALITKYLKKLDELAIAEINARISNSANYYEACANFAKNDMHVSATQCQYKGKNLSLGISVKDMRVREYINGSSRSLSAVSKKLSNVFIVRHESDSNHALHAKARYASAKDGTKSYIVFSEMDKPTLQKLLQCSASIIKTSDKFKKPVKTASFASPDKKNSAKILELDYKYLSELHKERGGRRGYYSAKSDKESFKICENFDFDKGGVWAGVSSYRLIDSKISSLAYYSNGPCTYDIYWKMFDILDKTVNMPKVYCVKPSKIQEFKDSDDWEHIDDYIAKLSLKSVDKYKEHCRACEYLSANIWCPYVKSIKKLNSKFFKDVKEKIVKYEKLRISFYRVSDYGKIYNRYLASQEKSPDPLLELSKKYPILSFININRRSIEGLDKFLAENGE